MLMSIIEYKHSYLNIIVAVVFVLKFTAILCKILIGTVKICCFFYLVKSSIYNTVKNVLWKISINSVDRKVGKCFINKVNSPVNLYK